MLMVMDLTDGLPKELIPRLEISELSTRGKYELATAVFPLGKRVAAEVETEVKPSETARGEKCSPFRNARINMTDQVKNLLQIEKLIASIPEPAPPKEEKKKNHRT
ncbi:MAG: hypothetical protein R3C11_18575 [Planctomycetaceae bacterium]